MSGTVAAIGGFVDLADGPKHPAFPGVGFITMPELSWRRFDDPSEIVATGQRVTCEVLAFDTTIDLPGGRLALSRGKPYISPSMF